MSSRSDLFSHFSSRYPTPSSIVVSSGSLLPVIATGNTVIHPSLHLNNVLVSPQLIKNFIYARQFTIDNNCSVKFDPAGCCVKDLPSWNVIVRCNSSGPLYPLRLLAAQSLVASTSFAYLICCFILFYRHLNNFKCKNSKLQESRSLKVLKILVYKVSSFDNK